MTQELKNMKTAIEELRNLYNEQLDNFRFEDANKTFDKLAKLNNEYTDKLAWALS